MVDPASIEGGQFNTWLGLRLTAAGGSRVTGELTLRPELHQPHGIVHGGVYCSIVESIGSLGGQLWLDEQGRAGHVVGVNNNTNFLRATRDGVLSVDGVALHQGRSQQLWNVEIRDAAERLVATGQLRVANLEDR